MIRLLPCLGLAALLAVGSLSPALAQASDQSAACRLFPLACPGPVPPVPPPLLGPPEDPAAAVPPPAEPQKVKGKPHVRKHKAAKTQ